jgi:hypothetical protein
MFTFYNKILPRRSVILVFKSIPEDDPDRDRNISELNFVMY